MVEVEFAVSAVTNKEFDGIKEYDVEGEGGRGRRVGLISEGVDDDLRITIEVEGGFLVKVDGEFHSKDCSLVFSLVRGGERDGGSNRRDFIAIPVEDSA